MKSVNEKWTKHTDFGIENNNKDHKHVGISKYKNIFAKNYISDWSEEVFAIEKVKNTASWTYVIKIVRKFYEK